MSMARLLWQSHSSRRADLQARAFAHRSEHGRRVTATTTNADGFGIGWYGNRSFPGVYRDVQPAWNDSNLQDLAAQIESPLFLAHVRSATVPPVQQTNCHPFRHGHWLFMHNGSIRRFSELRRDLLMAVAPRLFPSIEGSTDSELMFYLALTFGLEVDPIAGVEKMVDFIETEAKRKRHHQPAGDDALHQRRPAALCLPLPFPGQTAKPFSQHQLGRFGRPSPQLWRF